MDISKGKPVELVFQFPAYITGLETVSIAFTRKEIYDLTQKQGTSIVNTLKNHFIQNFKIDLNQLMLLQFGTNAAMISADGKLKLFHKPSRIIEVVIKVLEKITNLRPN